MIKKIILILLAIIVAFLLVVLISIWKELGQSPRGERLARILRSPNYDSQKNAFVNKAPVEIMNDSDEGAGMLGFFFGKKVDVVPTAELPSIHTDLRSLDRDADVVVWLGHSALFVQLDGIRYLFDPVLTSKFPVGMALRPFPGTDLYSPEDIPDVDYLVITHDHWDHLDYHTVTAIRDRVSHVVCALGVGQHFEYWGFDPQIIHEMDWDETLSINPHTKLVCLPSQHFSGRLWGNPTLWASFLIDGKKKIFVMGDGGYDDRFVDFGKRFPELDLAILENGQYNASWRAVHMLPDQLPKAVAALHPRHVMTYHNAKYKLSVHPWYEPLDTAYESLRDTAWHLLTPRIGQPVDLHNPDTGDAWWRQ